MTKTIQTKQTTNAYRRKVGDAQVTALMDGYVELSPAVWQGIGPEQIDVALANGHLPKGGIRNGITSFLINTGSKVLIVDSGAAGLFGPNSFAFPNNLADIGMTPSDIDTVLVTHIHPDHVGALIKDGKAALPNARIRVNEIELAFWTSTEEQARAPEFMRDWFDLGRAVQAAYDGRIETFKAGQDLGDGVTTIAQPGHTPGHTAYLLQNNNDKLLFWGDLAVSSAIQFPNPRAHMIFDIDGETGYKSRLTGFDRAVADSLLCAGVHLPFPAFGYVERRADAYAWVQAEWQYDVTDAPRRFVV